MGISSLSLPLPAIGVLLAVGAVLTGIAFGTHPGVIAAEVFDPLRRHSSHSSPSVLQTIPFVRPD